MTKLDLNYFWLRKIQINVESDSKFRKIENQGLKWL